MSRAILVGDTHGCTDEFKELMNKVQFMAGRDRLILLGDLVDKGPDSLGMLRIAKEIKAEILLGNHDEKHLRYRKDMYLWSQGKAKKPDYMSKGLREINSSIPDSLWDWVSTWPNLIYVTPDIVAVHAGFEPNRPVAEQTPRAMWRVRNVDAEGNYRTEYDYTVPTGGCYWSEAWRGPESVVYGHQMFPYPKIDSYIEGDRVVCWTAGIDTACCYGGRLTSLILYDDGTPPDLVDVKAKTAYREFKD